MKRKNAIKWGCALLACALFFGNVMMVPATPMVVYATGGAGGTTGETGGTTGGETGGETGGTAGETGGTTGGETGGTTGGETGGTTGGETGGTTGGETGGTTGGETGGESSGSSTTSDSSSTDNSQPGENTDENKAEEKVDDAAVAATIAAIDAIGEVTGQSGDAISAARGLYNSLNEVSKGQVTNINTLIAAEDRFAQVVAEQVAALEQVVSEEEDDTDISYAKEGAVTLKGTDASYIFIGDSRTVGMAQYVNTNQHIWSAKVGAGLSWMKSDGVPAVENKIEAGSNVVILMGVNDCGTTSKEKKYAEYINEKAKAWVAKGANVYYVSVNPITRDSVSNGSITNAKIETWNAKMQEDLSDDVTYIDTYNKLKGELVATDGLHYTKRGCQLIYNAILEFVEADTVEEVNVDEEDTIAAFQTKITSAVRSSEENTVTLRVSKPTGISNVGCQVALYNTETSTWDIVAESKMENVTIDVPEGKVRIRARIYKKYDTETAEGKWSNTVTIDAKGAATGVEKEDDGIALKVVLGIIGAIVIFFGGYFVLRKKSILGPTPLDNVFNFVAELLEKMFKKKSRK